MAEVALDNQTLTFGHRPTPVIMAASLREVRIFVPRQLNLDNWGVF
jgi:hypothetical protein